MNPKLLAAILLAATLVISPAQASNTATEPAATQEVARDEWLTQVKANLPRVFCQKKSVFRDCFKVTEDECVSEARTAVGDCAREMEAKLPAKLVLPADGSKWGGKIGSCSGIGYSTHFQLSKKVIQTPSCKKKLGG